MSRQEQLRLAQQRRRQRLAKANAKAISVHLNQETYEVLREVTEEGVYGETYAEIIGELLRTRNETDNRLKSADLVEFIIVVLNIIKTNDNTSIAFDEGKVFRELKMIEDNLKLYF